MSAQALPFPKAKKRGRKVTRGPCAQVIAFPTNLTGDELKKRWGWLREMHKHWECEKTDGFHEDPRDAETLMRLDGYRAEREGWEFNESSMRRDIRRWVEEIETRIVLKDRLEAMGASSDDLWTGEAALRFLFDRMAGPYLRPSA